MYKVFYCDIRNISDAEFSQELAKLPPLRRRYILSKKNIDDRKRSLAASVLIARAVKNFTGQTKEPVIAYGQYQKPYCTNYKVHFNASHSGNYTAVAVSDSEIGIDIESLREYSPAVAKKYFTEGEIEYISAAKQRQQRDRRFFELWTAKEAYLKMTGEGTDSSFCRSIWTPELCKTVAPYDKVYIVPDGYLHQYSLEYVFPEKECLVSFSNSYNLNT